MPYERWYGASRTLTGPRTIAASSDTAITAPTDANGAIIHLLRLVGSSAMTARGTKTGSTTKAISR